MTDFDGTMSTFTHKIHDLLDGSQDMYEVLTSIESINARIDAIICSTIIEPSTLTMETIGVPGKEALSFAQSLENLASIRNIEASMGITSLRDTGDDEIFVNNLNDEYFQSGISSIEARKIKGTSPEFLSKILSIKEDIVEGVIDNNTQLNRQS